MLLNFIEIYLCPTNTFKTTAMEKFTFFWTNASPFSNWHKASFELNGIQYNCTEQHMMHQKALLFKDEPIAQQILSTSDQKQQKALGRKVKNFDPTIWNANCKRIVYEGNEAKFKQNEHLLTELLATQGTTLVEASPYDTIWGIGLSKDNPKAQNRQTWRGKNWLGEVLTQLREDIIQHEKK